MKIEEVTKAYGPEDFDRIKAKKDKERNDRNKKNERIRREKEQSANAAKNAQKQRQDVNRAMADK
jgi:hypothetical protein